MFRAVFIDGPVKGKYIEMAAPTIPKRLFFAPAPGSIPEHFVTANGYMVVGYDQEPETPWPDQIEYRFDREQSNLRPHGVHDGMETGEACYFEC